MKKVRDFFYSSSDIFVTLMVLALAAGIIFWRVQNVMAYSEHAEPVSGPETKIDIDFSGVDLTPEEDPEPIPEDDPEDEEPVDPAEISEAFQTSKEVTVTVPSGSSCVKAGRYVAEALGFSDEESKTFLTLFTDTAKKLKLAGYIKSGTFTIPKGSNFEDILKILAKKK